MTLVNGGNYGVNNSVTPPRAECNADDDTNAYAYDDSTVSPSAIVKFLHNTTTLYTHTGLDVDDLTPKTHSMVTNQLAGMAPTDGYTWTVSGGPSYWFDSSSNSTTLSLDAGTSGSGRTGAKYAIILYNDGSDKVKIMVDDVEKYSATISLSVSDTLSMQWTGAPSAGGTRLPPPPIVVHF